jgi:hypothetical protein
MSVQCPDHAPDSFIQDAFTKLHHRFYEILFESVEITWIGRRGVFFHVDG